MLALRSPGFKTLSMQLVVSGPSECAQQEFAELAGKLEVIFPRLMGNEGTATSEVERFEVVGRRRVLEVTLVWQDIEVVPQDKLLCQSARAELGRFW